MKSNHCAPKKRSSRKKHTLKNIKHRQSKVLAKHNEEKKTQFELKHDTYIIFRKNARFKKKTSNNTIKMTLM